MVAGMEGGEVERRENPGGMVSVHMNVNLGYKLMEITVPVEAEELRQCGHCHRQLVVIEYDHNTRGALLRTCRTCLVSTILLVTIIFWNQRETNL